MHETATAPAPATIPYQEIPIGQLIESPWNPRKHYSQATLEELAASIAEKGVIEPIVVRPLLPGTKGFANGARFEIVAGSRRYRGSKIAGRPTVPSVIRQLDDVAALELAVIENGQRDDVHPLDEAEGYQALLKVDKHYTPAVVAARVGKSESYVYRRLKLLSLEADLRTALAEDRLTVAHAEKLLRLSPELRKKAAHPENGVVWRRSPLLEYGETWIPQREDLRPLNELESFIREKSFFDPAGETTRHFQPELAEQIDRAVEDDFTDTTDTDEAIQQAKEEIVLLTEDPMCRSRIGAKPTEKIPLTPSKWREVKSASARCEFTVRGAVVHGGAPRVLDVCVTKKCKKHFPESKKKRTKSTAAKQTGESWTERNAREAKEREAEEKAWKAVLAVAGPEFAAKVAGVKFSAALVRAALSEWDLKTVTKDFGVELTDKTAAQVMFLTTISTYGPDAFRRDTKKHGFDLGAVEKRLKAEAKKSGASAAPAKAKKPAAKKGKAKR